MAIDVVNVYIRMNHPNMSVCDCDWHAESIMSSTVWFQLFHVVSVLGQTMYLCICHQILPICEWQYGKWELCICCLDDAIEDASLNFMRRWSKTLWHYGENTEQGSYCPTMPRYHPPAEVYCTCGQSLRYLPAHTDMTDRQCELTCYAVGDVNGAWAGQTGRQRHALQGWSAGLAGVLTLALLGLCAAIPAACLWVACGHWGGRKHRGGGWWDWFRPERLCTKLRT